MRIILKRNYKLFKYEQVFGATDVFDETLLVDAGTLDTEPVGAVTCTIFTTTKIGTAETGKRYDVNWIWSQMVQLGKVSSGGASPQDAFAVSIKGMKVVPTGEIDTFPAYFRVDIGSGTPFQNVKSAIQKEKNRGNKRPVGVGTEWFAEYSGVLPNGTLPHGIHHTTDHEWVICGWDKEHPNCFKIDSHEGYYKYITEEEFNYVMVATYGSVALTISQTDQETIDFLKGQQFDLFLFVKDLCYNLIQILKAKLATSKTVPIQAPTPVKDTYQEVKDAIQPEPKRNMIKEFCLAVRDYEGKPGDLNYKNNNPGNIRGLDGKFLKFKTMDEGFAYLEDYVTRACTGKHSAYKPDFTITQFFEVFSPSSDKNDPYKYSAWVCGKLRISTTTKIKELLS